MLEQANKDRVVEIFADHCVDIPIEVDVPLESIGKPSSSIPNQSEAAKNPNPTQTTPKRTKKIVSRKKITPRRKKISPPKSQKEMQSPSPPHENPDPIPPKDYSNLMFDELSGQATVNEVDELDVGAQVNAEENQDGDNNMNANAGYASEKSVDSFDSQAQEALHSDNDELFEIRQRNKKLFDDVNGRIAVEAGVLLSNKAEGPHRRVKVHTANQSSEAPNATSDAPHETQTDIPPSMSSEAPHATSDAPHETETDAPPIHTTDAPNAPPNATSDAPRAEGSDKRLNFKGTRGKGIIPKKNKWPESWTSYEGGVSI